MAFGFVNCSYCNTSFLKDNRHINENLKLKHNFYCSNKCQYSSKSKKVELICENPKCNNRFKRTPNRKSFRNFCSTLCAMTIIGPENGLKKRKYCYCRYCGNYTSPRTRYCSMKCWSKAHQIPKEKIIIQLQLLTQQLGRTPTERECNFKTSAIKRFGSWTNAVIAAGLIPYRSLNQRMYKRRKCTAKDGHICNSISELIIDNWLYKHNINHQKETAYPQGNFTADWSLSKEIFVEYFGLANDSKRYDEEIKKKQKICKEFGLTLIKIYSKDLFPKIKLDHFFLPQTTN